MAKNPSSKGKGQKPQGSQSILEALREIGSGTAKTLTQDVFKAEAFTDQLFGTSTTPPEKKYSGDIAPGEKLVMNEVMGGKKDREASLTNQLAFERNLANEERMLSEKKINDLRLKLQALIQEVVYLTKTSQGLAQEIKIASLQTPVEAGIYHVTFFEKLLELLISFRKKIDSAAVWLAAMNKRAQKKNYWSMYKQKKGSFLLAPDHYLQRSAG